MIRQVQYPSYSMAPLDRISWGAIWAGAFVSLASLACLSLFGIGAGLASAPQGVDVAGIAPRLTTGAAAWVWLCGVAAYYGGGWVTAHLTRSGSELDNGVHALVAWSLATIGTLILAAVAIGGAIGFSAAFGPVLGVERFASPAQGGGAGLYGFVLLLSEALACVYGGRTGTRLYRPVNADARSTERRIREAVSMH